MNYDFNEKYDRRITHCRKWDKALLKQKFGLSSNGIPLDIAEMDVKVAPAIRENMIKTAERGDYGYTYAYQEYYDAVIRWNRDRHGVDLEKDWIKLVFGTCSVLHYLVQCFCQKGEGVMINTPAYDPFAEAVESGGAKLICNPLVLRDMEYYLDFEKMEEQFKTENVKVYIFCSPQNPSGRIWKEEELYQLSELCLRYNVLLVSDEVHREIVFKDHKFTSLWNGHPEIWKNSIICTSPNKGFNLGGLKSSYILIREEGIREKALAYLKKVYVTSPHVFIIPAVVAAYTSCDEWIDQLALYLEQNYKKMAEWFAKHIPKADIMAPQSSFLAWINTEKVFASEEEMLAVFKEADVSLVVGSYFVQDGLGWMRLNFGTQWDTLREALERVESVMIKRGILS